MCMIETARMLGMKKSRRAAMLRMRDNAAETRETLGMIGAEQRLIRAADRRLMELNNEINRLNDEIYAMEQELGITND